MIILNERTYIEEMINNKDLGKHPFGTVCSVARYYHSKGYKPNAIRQELEHFILRCDPDANLVKWSANIDKAVSRAGKRELIEIDDIPITKEEIEICKSAGEKGYQRLMFTMLCLAKYFNMVSGHDGGWVNCDLREIFVLADVSTTKKRQAFMISNLVEKGLVGLSHKIDNTNVQVLCIDYEGDPVLRVNEMKDIGLQYERYIYGERSYPRCQVCGKIFRTNPKISRKIQKYCKTCAGKRPDRMRDE